MIEDLFIRNKIWSAERKAEKADYFDRLANLAAAGLSAGSAVPTAACRPM